MNSTLQIPTQIWMRSPAARAVMDALGAEQALFVGGCVRNAIIGAPVDDIDIATKLTPDIVTQTLSDAGIKVIPTGIDHGTVTAVIDDNSFEITTLRKDVETDGRRAVIAFADTWEEDAQRRDFTMNTLLSDREGNIFDPLGRGIDDLKSGRVIFVGDAEQRIAEDILRILRFFRFQALYGRGAPNVGALDACKNYADKIPSLSRERITQEFLKILSTQNPQETLKLMFDNNVLRKLSVVQNQLSVLGHVCEFQARYGLTFIASRLFTLAGFSLENIREMEELLLLPKVFKKDMQAIDKILKSPDLSSDHTVKVSIYKHGRVPTAQALMIELATDRVMNGYAPSALNLIQKWDIPNFPITGEDLLGEGFKAGPELGAELARREEKWIENGFTDWCYV